MDLHAVAGMDSKEHHQRQAVKLRVVYGVLDWRNLFSADNIGAAFCFGWLCSYGLLCFIQQAMTQEQFIEAGKLRHLWDILADVGVVRPSPDQHAKLQQLHTELFGKGYHGFCGECLKSAMQAIFIQHDQYLAANAPVILSAGQSAKVETNEQPNKARGRAKQS
jgi:hypothetical protein